MPVLTFFPWLVYELLSPLRLSVMCVLFHWDSKMTGRGFLINTQLQRAAEDGSGRSHTHTHKHTRDVNACARASGSFHVYQLTCTPGGQVTSIRTYSGQTKISESKLTSHYTLVTSCIPKQHWLLAPGTYRRNQTELHSIHTGKKQERSDSNIHPAGKIRFKNSASEASWPAQSYNWSWKNKEVLLSC